MHYFQRWAENDKARAAVSGTRRCLALLCPVHCILLWPACCCGLHLLCAGLPLLHTAAAWLQGHHWPGHAGALLVLLGVDAR